MTILQDNPWVCDCRLLALRDYLSEANLNSTLTLCDEPEHLKGRPWSRLASEDFACKPLIDVSEQHVEGRLGFDVTFSCKVSGSPSPTIWWVLQNRQVRFRPVFFFFVFVPSVLCPLEGAQLLAVDSFSSGSEWMDGSQRVVQTFAEEAYPSRLRLESNYVWTE